MDKKTIRQAVIKNRGGFENATDAQLSTLWNSLPAETQNQYLESVKERKGKNAVSAGTEGDV